MRHILELAALAGVLALPLAAQAEGLPGSVTAHPYIVAQAPMDKTTVIIKPEQRKRFRDFVVTEKRSSYKHAEPLKIGAILPATGVTYYMIPAEYGVAPEYRYTVVNDQVVLVEPKSRKVMEIIE